VKSTCCVAAVLAVLLAPRSHAAPETLPKLAVLIVVDQMRADYVDRFKGDWTGGLKRMVTEGAWFQQAAYPYLTTVTCAGHATISTGYFPNTHGVFQNGWWDREAGKQMTCTDDPKAKDVGYGAAVPGGDSAYRLQVPTFAEHMRSQRRAHVVSLSLKARSAIMLAGRGGDAVAWLTDTLDEWATASAYSEKGVPAVKAFIDANPLTADFGKTWDRLLPPASYSGPDDGVGEAPPRGWTRSFPHPLKGTADAPDTSFAAQWERTPFADAYLGRFAEAMVESLQLGKHDGTDVLAISFSTPDVVGHGFGPASHEVQDIYAHLDKTLGALVDAIEQVVRPVLGQGRHVIVLNTNDIYFEPGVYAKILKSRELMTSVISAIQSRPGIQRAFRSEEIRGAAGSKDPLLRAAALSYFPGRSGDIVFAAKPGWMISAAGTTHGGASPDDQRVPILFLGHGVKPGTYQDAATPADLAPTLAALSGLSMKAEGRPLPCVQ
jgi:predicted AlkP superfamily pyrophosphatase or phosphodiesterase